MSCALPHAKYMLHFHTCLRQARDLPAFLTHFIEGPISMKHDLLLVIFFRLQHLDLENNDFGIGSFICNALKTHVQILSGTQLLRKIMLCKIPPVITFDIYFYHKSFNLFYYKYFRLNLPFIFFTK